MSRLTVYIYHWVDGEISICCDLNKRDIVSSSNPRCALTRSGGVSASHFGRVSTTCGNKSKPRLLLTVLKLISWYMSIDKIWALSSHVSKLPTYPCWKFLRSAKWCFLYSQCSDLHIANWFALSFTEAIQKGTLTHSCGNVCCTAIINMVYCLRKSFLTNITSLKKKS